jgi:hypothetical protein
MRGQVVRSQVRFDLDEPAPQRLAVDLPHQHLAEQLARDNDRVPLEERRV